MTERTTLTPKRAAMLLMRDWMLGSPSPHWMECEEINNKLDGWNYKVTEKRREQIIEQFDKILEPLRQRLDDNVQKFGAII